MFMFIFQLWEYEVVEAFFLSSGSEQYVELEFGPHGQHLALLLNGRRNAIKHSLPLNYRAQISTLDYICLIIFVKSFR